MEPGAHGPSAVMSITPTAQMLSHLLYDLLLRVFSFKHCPILIWGRLACSSCTPGPDRPLLLLEIGSKG